MGDKYCTQRVKTQPAVGDTDRNPPDHVCKHREWKDGFCKLHHPESIAEKTARDEQWNEQCELERREERTARLSALATSDKNKLTIENAIVLLVQNGYRVERIMPPNARKVNE